MGEACSTLGDGKSAYRVLEGRTEGKRQLGNISTDGRITFKNWDWGTWIELIWLRIGRGERLL